MTGMKMRNDLCIYVHTHTFWASGLGCRIRSEGFVCYRSGFHPVTTSCKGFMEASRFTWGYVYL